MNPLQDIFLSSGLVQLELGQFIMILVGIGLLYLAIKREYEPLLLLPIGFACVLANIPGAGLALSALENAMASHDADFISALTMLLDLAYVTDMDALDASLTDPKTLAYANELAVQAGYSNGILYSFYQVTIASGVAPLVIFMGVGAMTDFGPLLANPRTLILGAAAQFGIFATVLGAIALNYCGVTDFNLAQSAAIGIIGGADGPTAIYIANILAPDLLGAIAVAAYSYMALVPLIQPPIMKALTSQAERRIVMTQLRPISQTEKIIFPILLVLLIALLLPASAPLVGMFCFGNLMRESGVVDRLSETSQHSLINITTIFLGLSVGSKLVAEQFLQFDTLAILLLGIIAFAIGTVSGVLMAKAMNYFSNTPLNPLIGSAGVSAVPMAARVSNRVGLESNRENFLLMHAMGPNVAGVIGSAIAAGVMISLLD